MASIGKSMINMINPKMRRNTWKHDLDTSFGHALSQDYALFKDLIRYAQHTRWHTWLHMLNGDNIIPIPKTIPMTPDATTTPCIFLRFSHKQHEQLQISHEQWILCIDLPHAAHIFLDNTLFKYKSKILQQWRTGTWKDLRTSAERNLGHLNLKIETETLWLRLAWIAPPPVCNLDRCKWPHGHSTKLSISSRPQDSTVIIA